MPCSSFWKYLFILIFLRIAGCKLAWEQQWSLWILLLKIRYSITVLIINLLIATLQVLHPSKHFNIGSTLVLGWHDVTTQILKSTLKQRCVPQRRNLQRWTTSNQRCVFQRRYEQRRTTSKQRCYFQRRVLQRWVTSKQRCGYDLLQNNQNKPWERVKLYFSALNENHLKVKARSS